MGYGKDLNENPHYLLTVVKNVSLHHPEKQLPSFFFFSYTSN